MQTCKICGAKIRALSHFIIKHNISKEEYYKTYINNTQNVCCLCGKETPLIRFNKRIFKIL